MEIAIWRTGHEIADRVADSLSRGLQDAYGDSVVAYFDAANPNFGYPFIWQDVHIAYGILRGAGQVFRRAEELCKPWFNVDRGYFRPSHYDGYYRISCRGTQATYGWVEPDYERLAALKLDVKPWRGFAPELPVLVIPPTEHVAKFFSPVYFYSQSIGNGVVRTKGDTSPIRFEDYNYVLTFNSSVGWQALQAGIPCVSDPTHSMLGSWFAQPGYNISLDGLAEKQLQDREKLFATMAASQFTLQEIEQGKAWSLIKHYTSGSAMMAGKLSPQMLPLTPSADGLKARFQSTT